MKGFFSKNEVIGQTDNCQKCGLYKGCLSPRMGHTGLGEKEILIIAEAPGKTEDEQNKQLVGQAGELLRNHLSKLGLDLDKDFWKINAVNCRPPENRKPTATEIKLCRPRVIEAIKKLKPKFIWLMGGVALDSFFMGDFSDTSITTWRKRCIPDYDFRSWIVPLYHPSFILRNKDEKLTATFKRDLEFAVSCLKRDRVQSSSTSNVDTQYDSFVRSVCLLYKPDEINHLLNQIKSGFFAFDYETSGLNPYQGSPKIFFASISNGDSTYAFQMTDEIVPEWKKFLANQDINKIAHNLKFEDKWSRAVFGIKPKGWYWDTMVSQHILDGRKYTTGLKFQAYVRYGLKGYDKEIDKYKKDWTKVLNNPTLLEKSLLYCGMDSLLTFNLFLDQINEFDENQNLSRANDLFFKGNLALADVENNGICVDIQYYLDENKKLELQVNDIEKSLMKSNEARLFKNKFHKDIDLKSAKDLRSLFYDIKKVKPTKKTDKDNDSVDHSVLAEMNTEFTNNLLELRKLTKIKDTYLSQFLREACNDGKLHPSFNLNMVVTFRSSAASPNFQNIPVRDEQAKKITRSGIIPTKGNQLLEVDYSALEVRVIGSVSKDKVLIDYIKAGADPHKDEAKELFLLSDSEWENLEPKNAKEIRFYAKNQKVFPYFYGSFYKGCAGNTWPLVEQLGLTKHLKGKGIKNYFDFEEHCRVDENRFWSKFSGVKAWQNSTEEFYLDKGYINYVTGFRSDGYLTRNDLFNYPIQGPAFHCLLWSLIELNRELKKYKTRIIGQIHDSIVFDLYPPEKDIVFNLCKGIMTRRIKRKMPWIITPLEIEMEITEIDQAWYYKKEVVNGQKICT